MDKYLSSNTIIILVLLSPSLLWFKQFLLSYIKSLYVLTKLQKKFPLLFLILPQKKKKDSYAIHEFSQPHNKIWHSTAHYN